MKSTTLLLAVAITLLVTLVSQVYTQSYSVKHFYSSSSCSGSPISSNYALVSGNCTVAANCTSTTTNGVTLGTMTLCGATLPTGVPSGMVVSTKYTATTCTGTITSLDTQTVGMCYATSGGSLKMDCQKIYAYSDNACKQSTASIAVTLGCTDGISIQCSGANSFKFALVLILALVALVNIL